MMSMKYRIKVKLLKCQALASSGEVIIKQVGPKGKGVDFSIPSQGNVP